jgi:hypothetical protein
MAATKIKLQAAIGGGAAAAAPSFSNQAPNSSASILRIPVELVPARRPDQRKESKSEIKIICHGSPWCCNSHEFFPCWPIWMLATIKTGCI